ncbi:MAG: SPOR domain-containing protein, partial [Gallionella sp.]
ANQKTKPKSTDKPAVVDEGFVAQVGAYSNADTAKQELVRLKKWGFKAYTEKVGGMIRVRIGPYADREKAEKVRQQLEKHGLHPVVMNTKGT